MLNKFVIHHIPAKSEREGGEVHTSIAQFLKRIIYTSSLFEQNVSSLIAGIVRWCKQLHLISSLQAICNLIKKPIDNRLAFQYIHVCRNDKLRLFQIDEGIIKFSELLIYNSEDMIHLSCSIFVQPKLISFSEILHSLSNLIHTCLCIAKAEITVSIVRIAVYSFLVILNCILIPAERHTHICCTLISICTVLIKFNRFFSEFKGFSHLTINKSDPRI